MPQTTRPLRILHITLASEHGGLSHYVYELCKAMQRQGHDVTVAGDRGAMHDLFLSAPFPYVEIPLKAGPIGFIRSAARLRRFLRDHPVDVIHTHYRRATVLGRRLQGRRAARVPVASDGPGSGVAPIDSARVPPLVYTLHLSHIAIAGPRRWLTDFGDHTHAASEDARQWLIADAHVSPDRISLILHGIDPARFPAADAHTKRTAKQSLGVGLSPDTLVAAYVGRFDYPKNESWLLDLACATRGQMPNLHFLLVGGGPNEPALRDRIDAENLHDRVHLFGYRDTLPVYQATDLLLLPSAREGFSYVCAEAMSVGVPVLRTQTSGTSELIVEDVTGRSVPIDHDRFIDAAIVMLSDRAALERMGAAAARHVRETLTFDRQLSETVELYRRLAKLDASADR